MSETREQKKPNIHVPPNSPKSFQDFTRDSHEITRNPTRDPYEITRNHTKSHEITTKSHTKSTQHPYDVATCAYTWTHHARSGWPSRLANENSLVVFVVALFVL